MRLNTSYTDPLLRCSIEHINHHVMCTIDDNECMKRPFVCPNFATCHNTYGSYTCKCNEGFVMNDGGETQDLCTGK